MAPNFRHGRDAGLLYDKYDLTAMFKEGTISASVDTAETSAWGSLDKSYVVGERDVTAKFGGMFDGTTAGADKVLAGLHGSSTKRIVTFMVEGITVGRVTRMFKGDNTSYEVSSPCSDMVSANLEIQASEKTEAGVLLASPLAAVTSTGAGASVDNGAATSAGGVAHLHIVAASTITTGITVKAQHSTRGCVVCDPLGPEWNPSPRGAVE
jgi:hypothetical protein